MPELASVVIDLVTAATNKPFTYSVPESLSGQVRPGTKVRVPFGPRVVTGYIVPETPQPVANIRPISAVLGQDFFNEEGWQLAKWLTERYLCYTVEALHLILPPGASDRQFLEQRVEYAGLAISKDEAAELIKQLSRRAPAQVRILTALLTKGDQPRLQLMRLTKTAASSFKSLLNRGAVKTWVKIPEPCWPKPEAPTINLPQLTVAQERALSAIIPSLRAKRSEVFLLHGVTGSGKTEVYLRVLAAALAQGRSGIVLVPEIALTPQMRDRFVQRFGNQVAILHSGLRDKERYDEWRRIWYGQAQIVLGARSAIYAPLSNIGVIILDEEHETAYKQEESPRYHARDVALWRAKRNGAVTILGSATPAVTTYFQTQGKNSPFHLLSLPQRIANRPLPRVEIVDMRSELLAGNLSIFSRQLKSELNRVLSNREQAILFLNRRGYSTFVLCRHCGQVAECPHCELALTLHKAKHRLICHHCSYTQPAYNICPRCDSNLVRDFGCGTERVATEVKRLWPKARVQRLDADTSAKRGATNDIITAFSQGKIDVLVGTQMIAKGLDVARVTLVGVVSADLTLNLPDPYAWERTFQLLEQVSGRTGRGETPGRAIFQTYTPNHISIVAAQKHDYHGFYSRELKRRQRHLYPPFAEAILVRALAPIEKLAIELLRQVLSTITIDKEILVEGPAPSPFLKVGDKYRYQLLFKGLDLTPLREKLASAWPELCTNAAKDKARLTVDVDPLSYL
ncbi:MAG: replication restart helicase PriA [bacterium]|jgi:primosomal protein N' (replication factor Y)